MIKIFLLQFMLLFLMFSVEVDCRDVHNSLRGSSMVRQYKQIYIDQFRLTYFRMLLKKAYNNSKAIQEIINTDHSGFTEPILSTSDYKLIDSLTSNDNKKMKTDSVDGVRRAEGSNGKRPLNYMMAKMRSKWLDDLANKRYRLWFKSNPSMY